MIWGWILLVACLVFGWRLWQRYDKYQRAQRRRNGRPTPPNSRVGRDSRIRSRDLEQRSFLVLVRDEVQSRGRMGGLVFFLIIVVALLLAIQVSRVLKSSPEHPNLVVVLAPFTSADGTPSSDGASVVQTLINEWSSGSNHRLERPIQLLLIDTPITDAEQALQILHAQNADAVVWGSITPGGTANSPSLRPQLLWLPRSQLPFENSLITRERLAFPLVYDLSSTPINGEAVLGQVFDLLDLVQSGEIDRALTQLNSLIDRYTVDGTLRGDLLYALRGGIALMQDQATSAELDFRRALELAGGNQPEYWNNLGVALALQNQENAAVQAFNTADQRAQQQLPQALYNRGLLMLTSIDPAAAIPDLLQAHQLRPDALQTLLDLATAQQRANQLSDAAATLNQALELAPNNARVNLVVGRFQLAQLVNAGEHTTWALWIAPALPQSTLTAIRERLDRATSTLEQQALQARQNAASADAAGKPEQGRIYESNARIYSELLDDARYWRAVALTEEGIASARNRPGGIKRVWNAVFGSDTPLEQAQQTLTAKIDQDPTYRAHVQLGRVNLLIGASRASEDQFRQAIEINSLEPEAWYGLARVFYQTHEPSNERDATIRDALQQAIAADASFTPAYILLARLEMETENWAAALPPLLWLTEHRPDLTSQQIRLGIVQRKLNMLAEAERTLLPLANASDPRALVELALVYEQADQLETAEGVLRRALDLNPTNALAAYEFGKLMEDRGEYAIAEAAFNQAISANPNYLEAYLALGQMYNHELNQPDKAIAAYQKAIEVGGNDARNYEDLGRAFLEIGEYAQAAKALERSVSLNPNVPEAQHALAQAYLEQGRYEQARERERAAQARFAGDIYLPAQIGIAESFRRQGRFDEAIAAFNTVLDTDPNSAEAYVGLGRTAADQRDWQAAIGYYNRAIALDPTAAAPHFWLGQALVEQGYYNRALDEFDVVLQIDPEYVEAYYGAGRAYAQLALLTTADDPAQAASYTEQAQTMLNEALKRRPSYGLALLERGQIFERLGQIQAALDDYTRASSLLSDNATAPFLRGKILLSLNQVGPATDALELAVTRDPNSTAALYWLGRAYRVQERPSQALKSFERALTLNPGYTEARYFYGLTKQETNEFDAAREAYQTIIAQAPVDDRWRQQAEERIRELDRAQ